jgi:predicted DNA-binding transcriptional regulator AlpA
MVVNPADQPYMGVREVADYLNSTRQTVWNWSQRGDFPKPIAILKMGPIWTTDAIVQFKAIRRPRR